MRSKGDKRAIRKWKAQRGTIYLRGFELIFIAHDLHDIPGACLDAIKRESFMEPKAHDCVLVPFPYFEWDFFARGGHVIFVEESTVGTSSRKSCCVLLLF
jgi:hypothetical protein